MKILHIDLETYSETDIRKAGVYRYTEDPAFRILLFGLAQNHKSYAPHVEYPVHVIDLENGEETPDKLISYLTDPAVLKYAHNANFERVCLSRHFGKPMPPEQWRCTAAWARSLALPGSLGPLTAALGFPADTAKDKAGKRLIKKFCVPGGRKQMTIDDQDWQDFIEYCRQDVKAEMAVHRYLSQYPLPDSEWQLWALDQRINDRGIPIDMGLVSKIQGLETELRGLLVNQIKDITGVANPNSRDQLITWLNGNGVEVHDLTAATVAELLRG